MKLEKLNYLKVYLFTYTILETTDMNCLCNHKSLNYYKHWINANVFVQKLCVTSYWKLMTGAAIKFLNKGIDDKYEAVLHQ